jgi:hypothetical protein
MQFVPLFQLFPDEGFSCNAGAVFSPCDSSVVALRNTGRSSEIRIVDTAQQSIIRNIPDARSIAFSHTVPTHYVVGMNNGDVQICLGGMKTIGVSSVDISSIAVTKNGERIFCMCRTGGLFQLTKCDQIWHCISLIDFSEDFLDHDTLTLTPDENHLLIKSVVNSCVYKYPVGSGGRTKVFNGCVCVSDNGEWVFSCDWATIKAQHVLDEQRIKTYHPPLSCMPTQCFGNGRFLLLSNSNILDLNTKQVAVLPGYQTYSISHDASILMACATIHDLTHRFFAIEPCAERGLLLSFLASASTCKDLEVAARRFVDRDGDTACLRYVKKWLVWV